MARRHDNPVRVTIALKLADSRVLSVEASADALQFIGRYSRLPAFGNPGAPLKAHVVAWN